jgi:hypothetical protein
MDDNPAGLDGIAVGDDDVEELALNPTPAKVSGRWRGPDGRDRFAIDLGLGMRVYRSVSIDSEGRNPMA